MNGHKGQCYIYLMYLSPTKKTEANDELCLMSYYVKR